MLPPDVTVIRQAEDAVYDDTLKRKAFIRVEFKVGDHGPFVERFPKETFNAGLRDAKLSEFAIQIRT